MNKLDGFALVVLAFLILSVIAIVVILGMLPGRIARHRGHPHAEAVNLAGWLTLFLGFILWPVALVWAYVDIPGPSPSADELEELRRRIATLEREQASGSAAR